MNSSRRDFIKDTSTIIVGAGLSVAPFISKAKSSPPNEKIVVALIGARSRGFSDLKNALQVSNVECAAICDIDDAVLKDKIAEVEKIQGKAPKGYKDYRHVLERKDIDAVIIGTPDHWHCLILIDACAAGKDVYVEKPLGNSIGECRLMAEAARKYNRVVQVGQQQRSSVHWQEARTFIKTGKIGQLRKVLGNFNYGIGAPKVPDEPIPAGVDFDRWLGPAPERSFNAARFHGNWRMFWDYGGGLMTDWGVHLLDMALWVKDIKDMPQYVMSTGGRWAYPDHAHETFDTMSVVYQMPENYTVSWESTAGTQIGPYGRTYGLAYVGNDATLVIDRNGWEVFPGKDHAAVVSKKRSNNASLDHMRNFIDCMRSRKDPNCTIENGSLVAQYAHMGNVSLKTQSVLSWNNQTNNFGDNDAANALVIPHYRAPWKLPKV